MSTVFGGLAVVPLVLVCAWVLQHLRGVLRQAGTSCVSQAVTTLAAVLAAESTATPACYVVANAVAALAALVNNCQHGKGWFPQL